MTSILEAKKETEIILMEVEEVQGVGISEDRENLIVYVSKVTDNVLRSIPSNIAGYPIILKEVGIFKPTQEFIAETYDPYRLYRYRPVVGGISSGHYMVTAGTLGCIVQDANTDAPLLLSNNHVYANVSMENMPRATVGDPVYQPGRVDSGSSSDTVATLIRWGALKSNYEPNIIDAAVATPLEEPSPYILKSNTEYIQVKGLRTVSEGITVQKIGRTSGHTVGKILDVDFTGYVDYNGELILFTDQILAELEIQGGDSGSILLDENYNAVGLCFAGSRDDYGTYYCIANKINSVFSLLKIELPTGEGPSNGEEEHPTSSAPLLVLGAVAMLMVGMIVTQK